MFSSKESELFIVIKFEIKKHITLNIIETFALNLYLES